MAAGWPKKYFNIIQAASTFKNRFIIRSNLRIFSKYFQPKIERKIRISVQPWLAKQYYY